ncbi:MAG: pyridoxamine 5'-phosphate oxidase family protein [bacterium]|nr:pyridoxamine 5'-phosphate oxidase family protein [bacterium]
MKNLEERIFEVIGKPHLAGIATITEDGKPWVRYVVAVGAPDLTIRFSTMMPLRKVSQIKNNPEVHLNCGVMNLTDLNPYLQIQGKAEVVTTQEEKDAFWNEELAALFSGPEDPNYAVVIVKPYYIEYALPKNPAPPEIWTAR